MPRNMTMNGDRPSLATTPLDLRTSTRERGTPDCRGHHRVRATAAAGGGSPAPPACTGTGTDSPERQSNAGAPRKRRPADESSLRLPFRKRPITFEPDNQRQSHSPAAAESSTDRCSSASDSDLFAPTKGSTGRLERAEDERIRVCTAPSNIRRIEETRQNPNGSYSIHFLRPYEYDPFTVYRLPPIPVPHYPPPAQEHLLAGLALATRQDEDGDTALHIAVVQGKLAMVCKLIELLLRGNRSLDINNNLRQTPLHLAVITQQPKMVEALLNAGADPAALDRNGQSALHLCCEYDQRDSLLVVLSRSWSSACLEIRNYQGLSPLHLAVLRDRRALARMLLDVGADINATDNKSGQSPLMHAVESNNADMIRFLIESGCDVNVQSYSGNTALHGACGRGQVDTVRLLLKSGADSSLKNYHNDTPVMVAKDKKIADVLRGRGSNQVKLQDHRCVSVSPHGSNLTENGSPSSNHSRGCSPSTTPHTPHHSTSHSPKTPSTLVFPFY